MKVAIVGIDGDAELLGAAMLYLDTLPPEVRVYTLDKGEFHQHVVDECRDQQRDVVIMRSDSQRYGIQANLKRDTEMAKEVDKFMVYWDYKDPDIMLVITMAKLHGKVIHVNPHDNGGILSNRPKPAEEEIQDDVDSSEHLSAGSGKRVTRGICGFDDGFCEGDATGEASSG